MPLLSSSKESNIRENLASSSDSNTHVKGYPSAAHKTSLGDGRVRHPASLSSFGDRIFSLYMQIHRRVKNLIISPTNQVQPPASPASSAHPSAPYPEATPSPLSPRHSVHPPAIIGYSTNAPTQRTRGHNHVRTHPAPTGCWRWKNRLNDEGRMDVGRTESDGWMDRGKGGLLRHNQATTTASLQRCYT